MCTVLLPPGVNQTAVNKYIYIYIYIYIYHNAYLTSGLQFAVFGQQPTKRPSKIHKLLIAQLVYCNNLFITCNVWGGNSVACNCWNMWRSVCGKPVKAVETAAALPKQNQQLWELKNSVWKSLFSKTVYSLQSDWIQSRSLSQRHFYKLLIAIVVHCREVLCTCRSPVRRLAPFPHTWI